MTGKLKPTKFLRRVPKFGKPYVCLGSVHDRCGRARLPLGNHVSHDGHSSNDNSRSADGRHFDPRIWRMPEKSNLLHTNPTNTDLVEQVLFQVSADQVEQCEPIWAGDWSHGRSTAAVGALASGCDTQANNSIQRVIWLWQNVFPKSATFFQLNSHFRMELLEHDEKLKAELNRRLEKEKESKEEIERLRKELENLRGKPVRFMWQLK